MPQILGEMQVGISVKHNEIGAAYPARMHDARAAFC
jgi:hypothetical protein